MLTRHAGAVLGLFAFSVSVIAGLCVGNPIPVVLSRGLLALLLFFVLGVAVGAAARRVLADHARGRESEIRERFGNPTADSVESEGSKFGREAQGA
jgi:hypothetical protein